MNTQRKLIVAMSLCTAAVVPGLSFGALIDRGGGLIYDTHLDITWLADASYAMTSGYISTITTTYNDGRMTRQQAVVAE